MENRQLERKQLWKTKNFLIFNVALACLIAGFAIGIFTFSCSTGKSPSTVAYAEDTSGISAANTNPAALQNTFRQVAQKVMPVVVKIDVVDKIKQTVPTMDSPFDFFLNPFNRNKDKKGDAEPQEQEFERPGLGSGVIIKKEGKTVYVLTNDHVVGTADEIRITLHDQREFPAKLVGKDDRKDLALVSFETNEQVPVAELGNSDDLYVGDWAIAVGNPFGLESTVTLGIVSALGRHGTGDNISDFIQTDAAINPGNSGGALINIQGQVIGINTWIASNTGSFTGYGFAIPINNARKVINDLISGGKVKYGWLGVWITDVSNDFADALKVKGMTGAFVANVFKDSPADKGKILPGDFIVKLNNAKIKDTMHLTNMIGDLPADKSYEFVLYRQGKEMKLNVKLEERKSREEITKSNKNLWPGLSPFMITDKIRKEYKIPDEIKGVILSKIEDGTPAQIAGFTAGDVITKINQKPVNSILDFYANINDSSSNELMIKYWRNGVELIIGLVR